MICDSCELSKEDFCKKNLVNNKCSHYRLEVRELRTAVIKSSVTGCSWYKDMIGQTVTLVGEPDRYCGGFGLHVAGYIGKGILVEDLTDIYEVKTTPFQYVVEGIASEFTESTRNKTIPWYKKIFGGDK